MPITVMSPPAAPNGPDGLQERQPYRPGREIARGGMGAVLDTQDEKFQRAVAMKVMLKNSSEEGRRRFLQEARVLGQLAHPNIVPVHDLGVDEQGRLFYTMKLVKGVTLRAVLDGLKAGDKASITKYPLGQLLTVFQKVCDAMAFAHARGVVHRDLKPDNIMVGEFGEVLVMDWGLAKILPDSAASTALVAPGEAGTNVRSRRGDEADRTEVVGNPPPHVGGYGDATLAPPADDVTLAPIPRSSRGNEAQFKAGIQSKPPHVACYEEEVTLAPAAGPAAVTDNVTLAPNATPTPPSVSDTGSATLEGSVMGTPHFMSPEQARGAVNELDARSDVFSLGGVLYMMLTLEKPVKGRLTEVVLDNILSGRIIPPALRQGKCPDTGADVPLALPHCPGGRVPEALSAVAMKALQVDPARRYQSVAYLQADLAAYQNGFATSAEDAGVFKQLQLLILRHKLLASAAALLVLLTAGFIVRVMASERHSRVAEQEALTKEAVANADRQKDEAALARLRDTAPTFHEQALALVQEQQLEPALEKVGFAIDLMPQELEFRLLQANVLQTLMRLDEAKAAYATALRLSPTNAAAKSNLAFCDHLAAQVRRGEWRGNTLTNLLATLRQQERLDEAQYLDSYLGAEQRQLVETWKARLEQAKISFTYVTVNEGLTFGLHLSHIRDGEAGIEALKGMPLRSFTTSDAPAIRSLSSLAGMPLEQLRISGADLASLEPLKGMPLVELDFKGSRVGDDLRPLSGMKLAYLNLGKWRGTDLSPLAGMPLQWLDLGGTAVKDLTPLTGMPLTNLMIQGCQNVRDLSALAGTPLRRLDLRKTGVTNLTSIRGMGALQELVLYTTKVASLEPLRGMKLRMLSVAQTSVTNLSPLVGMPLEYLDAGLNKELRDIRPLAGLPLRWLYLYDTGKPDLSPLATCRTLEELTLPRGCAGMEAVRRLPKLRLLSYKGANSSPKDWLTAEEFWKAYDAEQKK